MTSRDHDKIFQRVLCVTLIAVTLIFTVILTDVFIDIDGLVTNKEPRLLTKTVINIASNKHAGSNETLGSTETVRKNAVNYSRNDEDAEIPPPLMNPDVTSNVIKIIKPHEIIDTPKTEFNKRSNSNRMLLKYLKKFWKKIRDVRVSDNFESKRIRRQVKITYKNDDTVSSTIKPISTDNDELYVEIETHFDSKGMKGMKKKKLINNLINKIQKAIHSVKDSTKTDGKEKQHHLQVKKRHQNPLSDSKSSISKVLLNKHAKRHLDQIISKSTILEKYADKSGGTWMKPNNGPTFLTASKSVNSAEMNEVDIDYNRVLSVNGIPQRFQKPLYTDSKEQLNARTYFDLGDLKFFIKNIDGTGLSIGFNQYSDEPPDPETTKVFTGIDGLMQKYNRDYNGDGTADTLKLMQRSLEEIQEKSPIENVYNENFNDHFIRKRSIKEINDKNYQSNEYKMIFNGYTLPYSSYQDIYNNNGKAPFKQSNEYPTAMHVNKLHKHVLPKMVADDIFYKKLNPSEILGLASLLDRKKRSVPLKKIKNIKGKVKVNRFINTNAVVKKKKILLNKKRNKRQIGKIKIIATDAKAKDGHSDDNIFIVDNDSFLADRAILKEFPSSLVETVEAKIPQEQYEVLPYDFDEPLNAHVFEGRSRRNPLMSTYPHILLENFGRSKENLEPYVNMLEVKPVVTVDNERIRITGENKTALLETPTAIPNIDELFNAIEPKNLKISVKIYPKNNSDLNPGFKEIHTSINKSFNKDGLSYTSLVNISEISKIEKLDKTIDPIAQIGDALRESQTVHKPKELLNKTDILQHKQIIKEELHHLKNSLLNHSIDVSNKLDHKNQSIDDSLQITKEDINKLIAAAISKLESQRKTTSVPIKDSKSNGEPPKTTEPAKLEILNKIQQNENVTKEILEHINKNTKMLETFLQKLSDGFIKLNEPLRKGDDYEKMYNKASGKQYYSTALPFFRPEIFFEPQNDTQYTIPFVYAYQQTYPINNGFKNSSPAANIIYHGHIHADAVKFPKNFETPRKGKGADMRNQTKYFIDSLDNQALPRIKQENVLMVDKSKHLTTTRH